MSVFLHFVKTIILRPFWNRGSLLMSATERLSNEIDDYRPFHPPVSPTLECGGSTPLLFFFFEQSMMTELPLMSETRPFSDRFPPINPVRDGRAGYGNADMALVETFSDTSIVP